MAPARCGRARPCRWSRWSGSRQGQMGPTRATFRFGHIIWERLARVQWSGRFREAGEYLNSSPAGLGTRVCYEWPGASWSRASKARPTADWDEPGVAIGRTPTQSDSGSMAMGPRCSEPSSAMAKSLPRCQVEMGMHPRCPDSPRECPDMPSDASEVVRGLDWMPDTPHKIAGVAAQNGTRGISLLRFCLFSAQCLGALHTEISQFIWQGIGHAPKLVFVVASQWRAAMPVTSPGCHHVQCPRNANGLRELDRNGHREPVGWAGSAMTDMVQGGNVKQVAAKPAWPPVDPLPVLTMQATRWHASRLGGRRRACWYHQLQAGTRMPK